MIDIEEATANPYEGLRSFFGSLEAASRQSSAFTVRDLEEVCVAMFANACAEPDMLFISIEDRRRIIHWQRIAALYARCKPRAPRKLRKAVERRAQARIEHGKRRIARIERRELKEERLVLQSDITKSGDIHEISLSSLVS